MQLSRNHSNGVANVSKKYYMITGFPEPETVTDVAPRSNAQYAYVNPLVAIVLVIYQS